MEGWFYSPYNRYPSFLFFFFSLLLTSRANSTTIIYLYIYIINIIYNLHFELHFLRPDAAACSATTIGLANRTDLCSWPKTKEPVRRAYANRGKEWLECPRGQFIYLGFIALVSFQVLQILYVQLATLGNSIFQGKNEATMPYHQYVVVEPAGVIAYSKPSLSSGSIVSSFRAWYNFCKGLEK